MDGWITGILGLMAGFLVGWIGHTAYIAYLLNKNPNIIIKKKSPYEQLKTFFVFALFFIFCTMLISEIFNPNYRISPFFYPIIGLVIGNIYDNGRPAKMILKGIDTAKKYINKNGKV